MTYLDKVREIAITRGIDPDEVEKDIVVNAALANLSVEAIAQSLFMVLTAEWEAKQLQGEKGEEV